MTEAADIKTTLRQALADGSRSADFEQFVEYVASTKEAYKSAPADVHRLVRFIELFSVAAVEGGREATATAGDDPEAYAEVIHAMCAGASIALCSAVLSILRDGTPASALRKIVLGSFRAGLDEVIRTNGLK